MAVLKIIAYLMTIVGIWIMYWNWRSIGGKEITNGKVIELVPTNSDDGISYKVAAVFKDRNGMDWRYLSAWSTSPPAHNMGDSIRIVYEADNPTNNSSLSFGTRFGVAWIVFVVGAAILLIIYGWQFGDSYLLLRFPNTHN
jgi:hypothetical protein